MSRLVVFWSPGGCGASTLLLNTAAALGARSVPLAAADFNLVTPALALYADLLPHENPGDACLSRLLPALNGGRLTVDELSRRLITGPGFLLLPGMLDVVAASRLTEGNVRHLLRLLQDRVDLVLADPTPGMDSIGCLPLLELADLILLISGPDLASRFHTRRSVIPLMGMGWEQKTALVYNRAGAVSEAQIESDIGLPVTASVPEFKAMADLLDAGRIAYDVKTILPAAGRFRQAVEQLGALALRGGVAVAKR